MEIVVVISSALTRLGIPSPQLPAALSGENEALHVSQRPPQSPDTWLVRIQGGRAGGLNVTHGVPTISIGVLGAFLHQRQKIRSQLAYSFTFD